MINKNGDLGLGLIPKRIYSFHHFLHFLNLKSSFLSFPSSFSSFFSLSTLNSVKLSSKYIKSKSSFNFCINGGLYSFLRTLSKSTPLKNGCV